MTDDQRPECECHGLPKWSKGVIGGRQYWECRIKSLTRARAYAASGQLAKTRRLWREKNAKKRKDQRFQQRYGISPQDRLALFEASDGLCAICYSDSAVGIDHDHVTGDIRGALCSDCNAGIGLLHDDPEIVRSALEYLTVSDQERIA